jgi:hypothetical protein
MIIHAIDLASFEAILPFIDWKFERPGDDLLARANDRTSLAYIADCYVALPPTDTPKARKLVMRRLMGGWEGWPMVVSAARRRRKAFTHAIAIGVLSDKPEAENYFGYYFFWRSGGGKDYFRHRKTFAYLEAPISESEIKKFELKRDYEVAS